MQRMLRVKKINVVVLKINLGGPGVNPTLPSPNKS